MSISLACLVSKASFRTLGKMHQTIALTRMRCSWPMKRRMSLKVESSVENSQVSFSSLSVTNLTIVISPYYSNYILQFSTNCSGRTLEIRIVPTDGIDPDQILNFRHQLAIKVRLDSFHQIFGTAGTKSVAVVQKLILKIGLELTLIFCLTHGAARCNIEVVFCV